MVSENYKFPDFTSEMYKTLKKWYEDHNEGICAYSYHGAIGGNLEFRIIPTSIGHIVTAHCGCGQEITLKKLY